MLVASILTSLLVIASHALPTHSMGTLLHAGPSCIIKPRHNLDQSSAVKHRGICYSTLLCKQKGGVAIGKCGLGNSCCVFPQSCNSISVRNSTYFTNAEYPSLVNGTSSGGEESSQCSLTIHRMPGIHPICQFRLDFIEYEIEGHVIDAADGCKNKQSGVADWITLRTMHTNEDLVPAICPSVGQHVTIDIRKHIGPFVLTVHAGSWTGRRRWNILINQIECGRNTHQMIWSNMINDPTA